MVGRIQLIDVKDIHVYTKPPISSLIKDNQVLPKRSIAKLDVVLECCKDDNMTDHNNILTPINRFYHYTGRLSLYLY